MSPRTIILTIEGGFFKSIQPISTLQCSRKNAGLKARRHALLFQAHLIITEY